MSAPGQCIHGPVLRVGGLEELAHEAEAGLADVGAAGKHIANGIDRTAEESECRDIWTGCKGGCNSGFTVLQKAHHLLKGEEGGD